MAPGTSTDRENEELDALCDLCLTAVKEAGEIALSHFGKDVESWDKSSGLAQRSDPVSVADLEVDRFLKKELAGATPGYGWLSEETEDAPDRLSCSRVWIVDPIDGTRAFLKGRPHFAVSVALVENGSPLIGAVFNPATSELFSAVRGRGALLNDQPIKVTPRADLAGCRMMAYADMFRDARWPQPWPEMEIEQRNSAAYRLALVAAGNFDATLSLSAKHDWDIAAAHLIVQEAGGRVTCHGGSEPLYNQKEPRHPSIVAAGPLLHGLILDRVRHMELPKT